MSATAWENRLARENYYEKLWVDCHLCGKPRLKMGPHMRTAHGWSALDEQRYRIDQEATSQEIPEGARKRKLDWSELIENENRQCRDQLTNIVILKFRTLYDCMKNVYKEIHDHTAKTLVDLSSDGGDIVDGKKDIDDAIERVLNTSFDHLDSTHNSERAHVIHSLTELAQGTYV
ncbi:MAG: hypothetical protein GY748_25275 [Planctomycetaceae bacterium]|nr:hypothetical protein [Planctomycetaceae bacterium]